MRKIFHFSSPREKYVCDAVVVWCYDNRFETALRKLLKRMNVQHFDPIRVAGGAKSLASPQHEGDRLFLLDQIRSPYNCMERAPQFSCCIQTAAHTAGWQRFRETLKKKRGTIVPICSARQIFSAGRFLNSR